MSMDVVADFCTMLRNATMVKKRFVELPHSSFKESIASVMKAEGYLKDYQVIDLGRNKKSLKVFLKYIDGHSAITQISSVSTSGSRVYSSVSELKPYKNGFGIQILSTSKGVLSSSSIQSMKERDGMKVGGEVLCSIW